MSLGESCRDFIQRVCIPSASSRPGQKEGLATEPVRTFLKAYDKI